MEKRKYSNPIIKGFYPDPSICKANDKYYIVTSSFEYFPGIPIFESSDLINWNQIGHCLTRETQLNLKNSPNSKGIYAPTIRYYKDVFYVIVTNVTTNENFIVTTKDPTKGWSDAVVIQDWNGIDPSLYFEGNRMFIQGNAEQYVDTLGIYQAELDPTTFQLITERTLICKGTGGKAPEAPHVFKKGEYYYLLMAEGGTEYGHMVTIFRSKNIFGPYESSSNNPILTHRSIRNEIQCVGHADILEDSSGYWWLVCLGVRSKGSHSYYHHLGRETFLTPIDWNEDGWPVVNRDGKIYIEMEGPLEREQKTKSNNLDIKFDKQLLDYDRLIFLRNPNFSNYRIIEKSLYLYGSEGTLNDDEEVSFVGIRQSEFNVSYQTTFHLNNTTDTVFGITTYMSNNYHYDVTIDSKIENYV